jgi:hypothetical protein
VPPAPVRSACRALERGRRNPRKGYEHLPHTHTGRHHDIKPAERVSPVTSGPVWPSPPLCNHPGPCVAIPGAAGTWGDKTLPRPWMCTSRSSVSRTLESAYGRRPSGKFPHSHPRSRSWARTGHTMTPDGSKIRQDSHQLRGVVRHTATRN